MTPKSFLELISLYLGMLEEKRVEMDVGIKRLEVGIKKLTETNSMVAGMQEELNALQAMICPCVCCCSPWVGLY